jgi:hypothetical protein
MRRKVIAISAFGVKAFVATLWKGRAQQSAQPDLSGEWELVPAVGTLPDGFVMQVNQSSTTLCVHSHCMEPENGEYGLPIVGLLAPELIFSTNGREDLNQAGPFVIHSKTQWSGTRLITKWSTSELMGVSFEGHGYVRFRQTAGNRRWRSMPIPRRDGTLTRPSSSEKSKAMPTVRQDIGFALRLLRRSPGFTATTILVIALATGANTAVFSLVYSVVFRPLPFPEPSRLVSVSQFYPALNQSVVSSPTYLDWSGGKFRLGAACGV